MPGFTAMQAMVAVALTAPHAESPVSQYRPLGTSTESTGASHCETIGHHVRYGSRSSPWKPVPSMASTTRPAPFSLEASSSSVGRQV